MRALLILLVAVLSPVACAQEIPSGITYKKASDAVNKQALDKLTKFLASKPEDVDISSFSDKVVICGPGLWAAIKGVAPTELQTAVRASFMVPWKAGVQKLEARGFKTEAQLKSFWKLFLTAYGGKPDTTIRKASAEELKYYWAWISYDIEEPLYIAMIGKTPMLFHFSTDGGSPVVFTVDLVGRVIP